MTDIVIAGIGQTAVGEWWDKSLRSQAAQAVLAALKDSGGLKPQALYIGNFLGSMISRQANLGSLLSEQIGYKEIEAYTLEAAGASGAVALRQAYLAVASGFVDVAVAVGVEKMTDITEGAEAFLATGGDYDYESVDGVTPASQAGLLMQRYMHEYRVGHEVFESFALLAHAHAVHNPHAMYRKALKAEVVQQAQKISDPLTLFDTAPYGDGAAAVVVTRSRFVPAERTANTVRILGSSAVSDTLALIDRQDPLAFAAAGYSVQQACRQAGIMPKDVDLFELDDVTSIYAVLGLEAAGLTERGKGWEIALHQSLPILTMGGAKARGYAPGANGLYQVVEACLQLRGEAGQCQVPKAGIAMTQSLGGPASTAVTHILKK